MRNLTNLQTCIDDMIAKTGIIPKYPERIRGTGDIERFTLHDESDSKKSGCFIFFPEGSYWCMNYKDEDNSKYSGKPFCRQNSQRRFNRKSWQQRVKKQQLEVKTNKMYEEKAKIAQLTYFYGEPVQRTHPNGHPYTISKGIDGYNLRVLTESTINALSVDDFASNKLDKPSRSSSNYTLKQEISFRIGSLMFPMKYQDSMCNIQFISPQGSKRFFTGARKKGSYGSIGLWNNHPVVLCEGAIDAMTIWQECHLPAFWTVDAGNMCCATESIINDLGVKNISGIIIAGDNNEAGIVSIKKTLEVTYQNSIATRAIVPPHEGSDFNDYLVEDKNKGSYFIKDEIEKSFRALGLSPQHVSNNQNEIYI